NQYLKSLETFAKQSQPGLQLSDTYDLRDGQMAENLAWLANRHYPKRKMIVWAANSHIMANPDAIRKIDGSPHDLVPMGHRIRSLMDASQIFTVAFAAWD